MNLNDYADESHEDNILWWTPVGDARPHKRGSLLRNKGELLMLIVSEIAEAMEGERKGLMDDKLPHRPTRRSVPTTNSEPITRTRLGLPKGGRRFDPA